MRKGPTPLLPAPRRGTVVILILTLALVFLCVVLAIGVQRLIAQDPDLRSQTGPADVGGQLPPR
jgi:hypothetical protein